ncbi:MAG: hypothetical protein IJ889_00425 [Eubacterium sp.]|nr:hypothetical protein [Eubacterium sp.]MBR2247259.1 hypothetical protein [Bacilli bacterium]
MAQVTNISDYYSYRVTLFFVDSEDNSTTEIAQDNIRSILIDKNFEDLNQPVLMLSVSVDKKILNRIIETQEDSLMALTLYKVNENNPDYIGDKVLEDLFIYMTDEDISYTNELDYNNDEHDRNDLFRNITFYLLKRDTVNNMNQVINTCNRGNRSIVGDKVFIEPITMVDLLMRVADYFWPLLIEPLQHNPNFDQVVIPPVTKVSDYIEYLNDNLYTFYDSGYRFFVDYDSAYIVSESGNKVEHKNEDYSTVIIEIGELLSLDHGRQGLIVDDDNSCYRIFLPVTYTKFTKNPFTKRLVTNVTSLTSSGDVSSKNILENITKNNTAKTKLFITKSSNPNIASNIESGLQNRNITLDINKPDLDASLFTVNKEYIIRNQVHPEYDGKYLIQNVKQVFLKQDNKFKMSTLIRFAKIESR